jgi:hypothetical protein
MSIILTYPGVYIEEIPSGVRTITGVATSITAFIGRKHLLLRRWDHGVGNSERGELDQDYGDLRLRENTWVTLEDGVQVCFQHAGEEGSHTYRTGDYWMIPARTATGDLEWPGDVGQPEARPSHGTEHHHAPLAVAVSTGDNPVDCRCVFEPLCESKLLAYRPRPE